MMKSLIIAATCVASTALLAMEIESKKPQKAVEHMDSITGSDGLKKKIKKLGLNLKTTAICFDFDENLVIPVQEFSDAKGSSVTWKFSNALSVDVYADKELMAKAEKKYQIPEMQVPYQPKMVAKNKKGVVVSGKNALMEDKEKLKELILWLKAESAWVGVCSAGDYSEERGKILVDLGFGDDIKQNYLTPAQGKKFPSLLKHLNDLQSNKQLPLSAQNIENVVLIDNDGKYEKEIDLSIENLMGSNVKNSRVNKENLKLVVLVNDRFIKMLKGVKDDLGDVLKWLDKHEDINQVKK